MPGRDCTTLKGRTTIVFAIYPRGLPRFARNDNKSEVLAVTGGCSGGVYLRLARCGLRLRLEGIPSFTIHSAEAISVGTAGRDEARPYK